MSHIINFRSASEMPDVAMSLGTTRYNKTGSWRFLRPLYRNRTSPCFAACPAGEDIAQHLRWVKEGQYERALTRILEENPFPGVCGRVCPHPCEAECNRAELGGAIAIHHVERFLADLPLARCLPVVRPIDPDAPAVAVIGSGPAGLSCAYQLARLGRPVTVFEALNEPGGMMRVGIPPYRLPRAVLDAEIESIAALGVKIVTNKRLGDTLGWDELKPFKALFLAFGQHVSKRLDIPGEELDGVVAGLDFLRQVNLGKKVKVGRSVAVIGGGNTAMDAARSALRLGAQKVTILYRRSRNEMPAIAEEIEETQAEGIHFQYLSAPVHVLGDAGHVTGLRCVQMTLGDPDERGRRKPIPVSGSDFTVAADMVITALGQDADLSPVAGSVDIRSGLLAINETGLTSCPTVFAGGDCATGFGTVAWAVGSGKRGALAIDKYLRGEALEGFPPLREHGSGGSTVLAAPRDVDPAVVTFQDINQAYFESEPRAVQRQKPVGRRVKSMRSEVNLGLSEADVRCEAERCFSCGTCNGCDNCWVYCPDVAISRLNHEDYVIDYDFCKGCGLCAEECPREAIAIEEELKWKK